MIVTIQHNTKIRTKNNHLSVERDGKTTLLPYKDITVLVIEGLASSISIQCLLDCVKNGVYIVCCDEKFYPSLHIVDLYSNYKLTERIYEQILWKQQRKEECFRKIIVQKIQHQKDLIEYFNIDSSTVSQLEQLRQACSTMLSPLQALVSTEGVAARIYFQALFSKEFRRFANDGINQMLNYGYSILRNLLTKYIIAKGLHPALGIHHNNVYNSYNLVDDCIEILRPMVDYIVYTTYTTLHHATLTKENKGKFLQLFFQFVNWEERKHVISYALEKYVDSLLHYMNESNQFLTLPFLDITLYDYN